MASLIPVFLLLLCTTCFSRCSAEISRKELRSKEVNQGSLLQSGSSIQSGRIDPSRVVELSWQPRVFVYKGFISDEECDHLISLAREEKEGAVQGLSRRSLANLDIKDEIVARIERKTSAWTLLPQENSRPLQVLRYGHEEAKQKYDYFGNKSSWVVSEPLMATIVLYLSNVSRGGDISFPESQLKTSGLKSKMWPYSSSHNTLLQPIKGNAVLFFNAHLNGSPDRSSHHERHPVLEGELWCATKFFHIRPISVRKVPTESGNSDCTDEDDNCPQWAAIGECQRNPTFMIGSPDYYGTCRKSCHVC